MGVLNYFKFWTFGKQLIFYDKNHHGQIVVLADVGADEEAKKDAIKLNLIMFVGIFLGVFFSEAVLSYFQGSEFIINFNWIDIIISLLITFLVIPGAYMYVMDSDIDAKSILVKLGLFVQSGVFWELLVSNIRTTLVP